LRVQRSFGGGSGGAHNGAGLTGQKLVVAGRFGVPGGYPRGGFCGLA
jgi:hypothetical protein